MTRPSEYVSEAPPLRNTTVVGGTTVGAGSGAAGEVPIGNGDGTATWALILALIVLYDNTGSGLGATNVQAAIDEVAAIALSGGGPTAPFIWRPVAISDGTMLLGSDGQAIMSYGPA